MNGVLEREVMDSLSSVQTKMTGVNSDYRSERIVMAGCGGGCSNPCSGACGRQCSDDCAATTSN